MAKARVGATGRVGEVLIHDPEDDLLSCKLQFTDGMDPAVDWFSKSDVSIIQAIHDELGDLLLGYVLVFAASKDLRCFFWTSTAARQLELQFPRTGGRMAAKRLLAKLGCHSANTRVARAVIIDGEGDICPTFDVWEDNYPIHAAAATGNLAAIMGLLEMGACLDQKNMFGYSALFWACAHDHREVVTYLVRRGAAKDSANTTNGHTALHVATMNGHKEIVSYLVGHGASKNYYDNRGNRPINVKGWRGGAREAKGESNREVITAMLR